MTMNKLMTGFALIALLSTTACGDDDSATTDGGAVKDGGRDTTSVADGGPAKDAVASEVTSDSAAADSAASDRVSVDSGTSDTAIAPDGTTTGDVAARPDSSAADAAPADAPAADAPAADVAAADAAQSDAPPADAVAPAADTALASDVTAAACIIPCFQNLPADCAPSGSCVIQNSFSGMTSTSNTCYMNGAKALLTTTTIGAGAKLVGRFLRTDGVSVCFTNEVSTSASGATVTYKNADNAVIATGVVDLGTQKVTLTCAGGGATFTFPDDCSNLGAPSGGTACTMGTCTP